ncbi:MAG TPA: hypothetical protein PLW32_11525 [Chitinophagaceae bacterium]|jgi:RsiW-degrading membrane proteinase PrsW (M82 family)|nr:hypothetical protein [Chitinophagaceae bacterium]HPH24507.1 hypothetical protein [Chitinophagaceae bacterium]
MTIDNQLNKLREIQQVEAPAFLLTRINQQIDNTQNQSAPVKWKLAFVLAAIILLTVNVWAFIRSNKTQSSSSIETVVSSMSLNNNNQLYHE